MHMCITTHYKASKMKTLVCIFLVTVLGTKGQVISEPNDVTVCEGKPAIFTCVLNGSMMSNNVQWYRLLPNGNTKEMMSQGSNIHLITSTINNTLNSSLNITNTTKSHTGYYWVRLQTDDVCNVSLTVLTSPPALTVNITKNTGSSSIVVQWDEVDDSLPTTYTVTWSSERDLNNVQVKNVEEQSSYTITGLALDTVYTITVSAVNKCGFGPQYSTNVSLTMDTTSTVYSITSTASLNPSPASSSIIAITNTITTTATILLTTDATYNVSAITAVTDSVITTSTINPSSITATTNFSTSTSTKIITVSYSMFTSVTNSSTAGTTTKTYMTNTTKSDTTTTGIVKSSSIVVMTTAVKNFCTTNIVVSCISTTIVANSADTTSDCTEASDSSGISTGAAVVITFTVTFIVSVTATAIITFIVAYVCVKRTFEKANNTHNPNDPMPQEKVLYEQVCIPSKTVTKNDLELQPNPAYGTSCKVAMDTNPAYESCK